jgi:signal transduction histidine kinase
VGSDRGIMAALFGERRNAARSVLSQEKFTFAVDSALLGELGEKLVSTVHVALTELVKNAYDADATAVTVRIEPQSTGGPRIAIQDDGIGMRLREVRDYWMKIGTTNKVDEPRSPRYGRLKTGSKGVGRFACRRLGLNLTLRTVAKLPNPEVKSGKRYQATRVEFNWADFKPGTDVEDIECIGETSASEIESVGTRLEIWGAREDEWKRSGIDYMKRQLAILATNTGARRKGFDIDPGFSIRLELPDSSEPVVDLRDELLDATWGTLSAHVDAKGRAHCQLNAKNLGTRRFTSSPKFKNVAGAQLKIGIMPVLKDESRKPQILSNYAKQGIVEEWGGVQIRFNGFRMFPYGDSGDDWLRIDADRGRRHGRPSDEELFQFATATRHVDPTRALLNLLSMRNHLGFVDVTSEIAGLEPKIDRQGFVDNEVFESLRAFARFAIEWATIYRELFIRLREEKQAEEARVAVEPVLKRQVPKEQVVPRAASYLRSEVRRLVARLPAGKQRETEQALVKTIKAIETRSAANQLQLEHLRLIASASTLTLLFAHEIRTVIGSLGAMSARLDQVAKRLDGKLKAETHEMATQLRDIRMRFDTLVDTTGIVGAFNREPKLERLHLKVAIERAARCFSALARGYHIQFDFAEVGGNVIVGPMVEGELYTVLLNLLSNSIKSVIASGGRERLIRVEASRMKDQVRIRVLDNGVGLSEDHFEDVFTPFISDPAGELYDRLEHAANPEDATIFGTGSGLGLSIVRDIVTARKGSVRFVQPPLGWKACVELTIP